MSAAQAPLVANQGGGSAPGAGGGGGAQKSCLDGVDWMRILRIFGGLSGIALIVVGLVNLFLPGSSLNPKSVVNALYQIMFGLLIIMAELRWRGITAKWFRFLTTYVGLGVFYVFVGGIALGEAWWEIVLAIATCTCGAVYLILGCSCKDMFAQTPEEKAAALAAERALNPAAAHPNAGVNRPLIAGGVPSSSDEESGLATRSAYVNDKEMMAKLNQSMGSAYRTEVTDMEAESRNPFNDAKRKEAAAAAPKKSGGSASAYGTDAPNPFENPFAV